MTAIKELKGLVTNRSANDCRLSPIPFALPLANDGFREAPASQPWSWSWRGTDDIGLVPIPSLRSVLGIHIPRHRQEQDLRGVAGA